MGQNERRIFPRISFKGTAILIDDQSHSVQVTTNDMSMGGIGIYCSFELTVDSEVKLSIEVPSVSGTTANNIWLQCTVAYCILTGDAGDFMAGLQFKNISDDHARLIGAYLSQFSID
ncbi:MAG: PilZ domain-containing protein [Pseudomonadota bacterium]